MRIKRLVEAVDDRSLQDILDDFSQLDASSDTFRDDYYDSYEKLYDYISDDESFYNYRDDIISEMDKLSDSAEQVLEDRLEGADVSVFTNQFDTNLNNLLDLVASVKQLSRVEDLIKKEATFKQNKKYFTDDEYKRITEIFNELKEMLEKKDISKEIDPLEQELEKLLNKLSDSKNVYANSKDDNDYDKRYDEAKDQAERNEIIAEFFKDEDFWGKNISYYDLSILGSPLTTELHYKGFNEKDNPFLTLLKKILPNKDITEEKYRVIHNAYVNNDITDDDLTGKKNTKISQFLDSKQLWKQSPDVIEKVIENISDTDFRKNNELAWKALLDQWINRNILNKDNYKILMSIINSYIDSSDQQLRNKQQFNLLDLREIQDSKDRNIADELLKKWKNILINADDEELIAMLKYIANRIK